MSQLVIDVSDLLDAPGASKSIRLTAHAHGLRVPLGGVEEEAPILLGLQADSVSEGVAVSGEVSGDFQLSCVRCLKEFREGFIRRVDEIFSESPEEDDYPITSGTIDLEPMIRDVVVLSIPTRPLHDPGCQGLCPTCGADRNLGDCGHSAEPVDIRWAPLAELLADAREGD